MYKSSYLMTYLLNGGTEKSSRITDLMQLPVVTFRTRGSRGEMYIGHGRLGVCVSVPRRIPRILLHGPGCKLGKW